MNNLDELLDKLRKAKPKRPLKNSPKSRARNRLHLERLEERSLMAVIAAWSAENTAVDSVSGNNGTLINGASCAAGPIGQAFSFDGVKDRVSLPDSPSLKLTT